MRDLYIGHEFPVEWFDQGRWHYVYRVWDRRHRLLYVGMTGNLVGRWQQHRTRAPWFPLATTMRLERYETRTEASGAERRAIADEGPLYNVMSTPEGDRAMAATRARTRRGSSLVSPT